MTKEYSRSMRNFSVHDGCLETGFTTVIFMSTPRLDGRQILWMLRFGALSQYRHLQGQNDHDEPHGKDTMNHCKCHIVKFESFRPCALVICVTCKMCEKTQNQSYIVHQQSTSAPVGRTVKDLLLFASINRAIVGFRTTFGAVSNGTDT